jgi:hypothetical protein
MEALNKEEVKVAGDKKRRFLKKGYCGIQSKGQVDCRTEGKESS